MRPIWEKNRGRKAIERKPNNGYICFDNENNVLAAFLTSQIMSELFGIFPDHDGF